MKRVSLFFVMVTLVTMVPALSWGGTLYEVKAICPGGETFAKKVSCEPGLQIVTTLACPNGQNYEARVDCPLEVKEDKRGDEKKPLTAFLLLDLSLTGGVFGLGKTSVAGGTEVKFGMEIRPHKIVGVELKTRFGITGPYWDCQKVKASLLTGAGLLLTVSPSEKFRMGLGLNFITVRDSSWTRIIDGLSFDLSFDWFFYKELGLRLTVEVGPGWDAAHQLHTWWGTTLGLVYSPVIWKR
ncbi:MAG: hypothetical protein ACOXZY_01295 [Patescibacteria group bacterium]|jgi:hypothetical protein